MQEIREFAPVLIPTLNRYEHFKRCIESLARCTHADKTELVIGLDYPPNERYREGWEKISDYVNTITGFRKVTILRSETNLGANNNSRRIREYIQDKYQTYIFSEDDNEFSPCFLEYIDKVLTRYWDDERVTSVSGYNYPVDMDGYEKNIYSHHQYSAWGVGIWVHKYKRVPVEYSKEILKSPINIYKILRAEPKLLYILMLMIVHEQRWGDTLTVASNIINKQYSIFPTVSLCRNHGHDGSGLHCGGERGDNLELFRNQNISRNLNFEPDVIEIKDTYLPNLKKYLGISLKEAIYYLKMYFVYLIKK